MKIEIIPALDIIDGKCVRLSQGDYNKKKVYGENPLNIAKQMEDAGITRLHVVDLDGALSSGIVNINVLRQLCSETSLTIDFGGGIKTEDDIDAAFQCGVAMVTVGSMAVKKPDLFLKWLNHYGGDKIILGADVDQGKIAVNGWQEQSSKELFPFLEDYIAKGVQKVICTDISKDGMLQGTNVNLYKEIQELFPDLYLIASGGISSLHDIDSLLEHQIPGVIIGKALYEGNITLKDLQPYL
ncbi:MAG: 1-(5-phosphoribosyl)-5-[(5-phosphoribosylamino)methylideneamino]imidazole-4-carboxamide isomerase [Bacteroidales bacterium]|nr:1-(5-phosphoribosyl)-5-[(5-phosphoribosylamino)methylideneamino]imidazole-4-carboxamide isomerase [Bacteroidales bacterium]